LTQGCDLPARGDRRIRPGLKPAGVPSQVPVGPADRARLGDAGIEGERLRAFLRGARNLSLDAVDLRWARLEAVDLCGPAEERGRSRVRSGRGARRDEPAPEEPAGDFVRPSGFQKPLFVDLRGASFAPAAREWQGIAARAREALPAAGKLLDKLLAITKSASKRRALSCVDTPGGRASGESLTLLFHAAQLVSPAMQRLRQRGKLLDEDEFYRGIAQQLADSSMQSVPGGLPSQVQLELAPFVARSVVQARLGADVASKYDRAVACWLINENDRPAQAASRPRTAAAQHRQGLRAVAQASRPPSSQAGPPPRRRQEAATAFRRPWPELLGGGVADGALHRPWSIEDLVALFPAVEHVVPAPKNKL
jgi:hypothetical protein